MSTPEESKPHVLILGAGLGGLTLAQALRKREISHEVFERDHDSHDRLQGYAIVLHFMLDDLHSSMPTDMPPFSQVNHLLPLDIVPEIAVYTPESDSKMAARDDGTGMFMRANRAKLREWLSNDIPIQFNKKAVSIKESTGSVTAFFQDGSSATGDIVVGADGVHSMTRKHILGNQPDPLRKHRTATVSGELCLAGAAFAEQLELGHSAYILDFMDPDGQRHHLFVGLNRVAPDGKSADYYWTLMWDCEGAEREDHWTLRSERDVLLKHAQHVSRELPTHFRTVIEATPIERMRKPGWSFHTLVMDTLPVGRVTLLGDAAHAMTPFRGEGGCHAMQDALNLARAIDRMDKGNLQSKNMILAEYQEEMLERGGRAAMLSDKQFERKIESETHALGGKQVKVVSQESIVI